MIYVCEPICTKGGHEKFNSALLYGVAKAYPDEAVVFYAAPSQIEAIKTMFRLDGIHADNIVFRGMRTGEYALSSLFFLSLFIASAFRSAKKEGVDRILFTSAGIYVIASIKYIFSHFYRDIRCVFVFHGEFERIAGKGINLPVFLREERSPLQKVRDCLREHGLRITLSYILWFIRVKITSIFPSKDRITSFLFGLDKECPEKSVLLNGKNDNYHYIFHADYIVKNARSYMDIDSVSPYVLTLPTYFSKEKPLLSNRFVKFALFGKGNPGALRILADKIQQRNPSCLYEIRIIGTDSRNIADRYGITCCSWGVPLSREEMLYRAEDIDVFLFLYEKSRYGLSCSGAIMEALSAVKPIIHLDNDCINYFNTEELPIGVRCETLDAMADKMVEIIENYENYAEDLERFRSNIRILRQRIGVESQLAAIRDALTFEKKETD